MNRLAVPAKARRALDAFIGRCLDPLPTAVLVDTHYNVLMRRARKEKWENTKLGVDYLRAAVDFYTAEGVYRNIVKGDQDKAAKSRDDRWKALGLWREGIALLARTPAPDAAAVAWKRRLDVTHLPITAEALAKAISEDEAFLAAHPCRTTRATRKEEL